MQLLPSKIPRAVVPGIPQLEARRVREEEGRGKAEGVIGDKSGGKPEKGTGTLRITNSHLRKDSEKKKVRNSGSTARHNHAERLTCP